MVRTGFVTSFDTVEYSNAVIEYLNASMEIKMRIKVACLQSSLEYSIEKYGRKISSRDTGLSYGGMVVKVMLGHCFTDLVLRVAKTLFSVMRKCFSKITWILSL